jgi:hypothetical protein
LLKLIFFSGFLSEIETKVIDRDLTVGAVEKGGWRDGGTGRGGDGENRRRKMRRCMWNRLLKAPPGGMGGGK